MAVCPATETLQDLLRGDLAPEDASSLREHLGSCEDCLGVLDRLSDDPELDLWLSAGMAGLDCPSKREVLDGFHARSSQGSFAGPGCPASLGPYEIEEELGRGGMGVVYRAADRTTGRVVALKVLRPDPRDDRARRRFIREIRAASKVEHDHVVRVYGTSDPSEPVLYFAMEYLAGPSLAGVLRERGRLSPREAARVVAQVADGLAAAHAAGLVHRDVKPDNVLFDHANGRAKIGDFGLARVEAETSDLTRDGVIAGTPAYLSPEQARGDPNVGPHADLYALGVTLYECLAGETPFRGTPHRVVHQILEDEPRSPRALNDAVPRDLETVCLKAMAKKPNQRYASTAAMADDLNRWLRGEPVRARPVGPAGRLWRLTRRKPLTAVLLTALALVLVTATVTGFNLWRRAEASAARSRIHLAEASRNYRQARDAVDRLYLKLSVGETFNKPGLEAVRGEFSREVIGYYREFLRQRVDDPALRADAAEAGFRVGLMITQTGDKRDALATLDFARSLFEPLARENPDDLETRDKLAKCHDQIGLMLMHLGRIPEALAAHRSACDVYRGLVASAPNDPHRRRLLGHGLGNLANTLSMRGKNDEARVAYGLAREQQDALLKIDPANDGYRSDLAMTLHNLAMVSDPDGGIALLREALAIRRTLAAEKPGDTYLKRNVGRTLNYLAHACENSNRFDEALPLIEEACELLREVVKLYPGHIGYRGELAEADMQRAVILDRLDSSEKAFAALKQGLENVEEIVKIDPENGVFRIHEAFGQLIAARLNEKAGRLDEALKVRRTRLPLLQRIIRDYPERDDYPKELAEEAKEIERLIARIAKESDGTEP